jgi:hypothetical protein
MPFPNHPLQHTTLNPACLFACLFVVLSTLLMNEREEQRHRGYECAQRTKGQRAGRRPKSRRSETQRGKLAAMSALSVPARLPAFCVRKGTATRFLHASPLQLQATSIANQGTRKHHTHLSPATEKPPSSPTSRAYTSLHDSVRSMPIIFAPTSFAAAENTRVLHPDRTPSSTCARTRDHTCAHVIDSHGVRGFQTRCAMRKQGKEPGTHYCSRSKE